ncbi:hypothetical protein WA026_013987 [Henosepilachna vigintioctopunctata]|uniref:Uncharacterized protein n=1 Tax=Henosepilachna vigintioctopunctata TaxID=420089 RepID=A0AAW1U7H0_9CUCU
MKNPRDASASPAPPTPGLSYLMRVSGAKFCRRPGNDFGPFNAESITAGSISRGWRVGGADGNVSEHMQKAVVLKNIEDFDA